MTTTVWRQMRLQFEVSDSLIVRLPARRLVPLVASSTRSERTSEHTSGGAFLPLHHAAPARVAASEYESHVLTRLGLKQSQGWDSPAAPVFDCDRSSWKDPFAMNRNSATCLLRWAARQTARLSRVIFPNPQRVNPTMSFVPSQRVQAPP